MILSRRAYYDFSLRRVIGRKRRRECCGGFVLVDGSVVFRGIRGEYGVICGGIDDGG